MTADAELRTSRPTPRPADHDNPRVAVAANAIGWELHRHDREVTDRGDGIEQITVTAAEAAEGRRIAERVVAHLDVYDAFHVTAEPDVHELSAAGLDPDQEMRDRALGHLLDEADKIAAYIRDGSRP